VSVSITSIQRRWDEIAIDQLRAEVLRLHSELEEARSTAECNLEAAEAWKQEAAYLRDLLDMYRGPVPVDDESLLDQHHG
jgi:hypothetical protein